ncbi:hypothetical protein [Bombilactobacillus bombi]|uniref:hypothetical protein n=1 Tax=Bombilactobacillus bombi TaxID=1303590 RepID=UPI0015E59E5F|nr:hypothetical protein [Bombilactobacillus bombi]MBA1434285.1 hypothetical protein [Bombilactobacillus bombi]
MILKHRLRCSLSTNFFIFILITLVFQYFYVKYRSLPGGDDLIFHYARLQELLSTSNFPVIATYGFGNTGNLVNVFYPVQFLYPLVWAIKLWKHPVLFINCWLSAFHLLTLFNCDWISRRFNKPYWFRLVFAVVYTFSFYRLQDLVSRAAWGEYLATAFLPLVFGGFYLVLHQQGGRWLLFIGMIGLLFSHVLTTVMMICLLLLWLIVDIILKRDINWKMIQHLLQVGLALLGVGFIFWAPFLQHYLSTPTGIQATQIHFSVLKPLSWSAQWLAISHNQMITATSGANTVGPLILTLLIINVIIFILHWPYFSSSNWLILGSGIIAFWLTTPAFPWRWLHGSFINVIQFPFRFNIFATLAVSWCTAQSLSLLSSKKVKKAWTFILLIITCGCGLTAIHQYLAWPLQSPNQQPLTEANFSHYRYPDQAPNDYFPRQALKSLNQWQYHWARINGRQVRLFGVPHANSVSYRYHSKVAANTFDLPVLCYSRSNYQVTNNGHPLAYYFSKRGTIALKTRTKDNLITVRYCPTLIDRFSWVVSLVSLGLLALLLLLQQRLNKF